MLFKINAAVMNYDWGSTDAVEKHFGIPNPDGKPVAELWYGAHPKAPSTIEGSDQSLYDVFQSQAEDMVGKRLFRRFGKRLPFLLKILAASKGLSIQAHPSKSQAEAGFKKEESLGIDISSPSRNYRDDNHKPECMIAIEDFWALSGFRPSGEIADLLELACPADHNTSDEGTVSLVRDLTGLLRGGEGDTSPESTRLSRFYSRLMTADAQRQNEFLECLLCYAESLDSPPDVSPWYWISELNRQFPGDVGCIAPIYLNVLKLLPGEGLAMKAGILHAYLRGCGYELMANSDNVLRGGCTSKHVDVPELLSVLRFTSAEPRRLETDDQGWYPSFVPEFQFFRRAMPAGETVTVRDAFGLGERPAILLVQNGPVEVSGGAIPVTLESGDGLFVSHGEEDLVLSANADAVLVMATSAGDSPIDADLPEIEED